MKKIVVLLVVFLLASPLYAAGPFGIEKGMPLASLGKTEMIAPSKYIFTPTKSHPSFETYVAQVSEGQGVCWVKAVGKDIATSVYGTELKGEFNSLKEKLNKNYGDSETYDFLMPDSIWNEPKDFMPALIKKERVLAAMWKKEYGSKLSSNLIAVALIASGTNRQQGYLSIEYQFDNYESCQKEIDDSVDDAL